MTDKWWVVKVIEEYAAETELDLSELVGRVEQSAPPMTDNIMTFDPDDVIAIDRVEDGWEVLLDSGTKYKFDFLVLAKSAHAMGACGS